MKTRKELRETIAELQAKIDECWDMCRKIRNLYLEGQLTESQWNRFRGDTQAWIKGYTEEIEQIESWLTTH